MKTKRGEKFDANKFGLGEDARFDVIVDEAPISPNQKEATWAALQPFMATLPPNAVKIALKYSPLPETAAEEMGNAIEQASQPQADPQAQKAMQEGQKQLQALSDENAQLKDALKQAQDQTHVDEVKVNVAAHDSETRRMKAEAEIAQPTEIDELRQHLGVLAQGMQAMMQHLQGGNSYGG